jgi:hypothetical protein
MVYSINHHEVKTPGGIEIEKGHTFLAYNFDVNLTDIDVNNA